METFILTYWQRQRLEAQLRSTPDARVYRRTLALLQVAQGQPIAAVARLLRVSRRAVHYWLAAYAADPAPASLRDHDRPGRPRLLSEAERGRLRRLLDRSPQELGYFHTEWTVPLLSRHLAGQVGRPVSDDTVRRELRRLDFTWKRPRYALDPDPELRGKKAAHPAANQAAARAQRAAGGGRDRPAAVPAVALLLVAAG
jgi:transposase